MTFVKMNRSVEKQLRKLPKRIQILLQEWVRAVELEGIYGAQLIKSYRDHLLKGNRYGQRSASLDYSYRDIMKMR